MQDEIMLARSCLLSGDNTKDSMSSVIRLLDQTYQRLVCDENNTDTTDTQPNDPTNNGKQHNLSRSGSKDQTSVKEVISKECIKEEITAKEDKSIEPAPNINNQPALVKEANHVKNNTESYKTSTHHNEISSTASSSSIVSSSLSTTVQPPNASKTVSNAKVGYLHIQNKIESD